MAAVRRKGPSAPLLLRRRTALSSCCTAAEGGKNCRFSAVHRAHFPCQGVDNRGPRRLYKPSWRAAAWRDGASTKPLTVYAVNHPAMSYGHVGCAGFGGFPACRGRGRKASGCLKFPACWGRGRKASGCLKSESEERETWTAESLRAAFLERRRLRLCPKGLRPWKRLRRSTFQVNTMIVTVSNHRNGQSGTSSKAMREHRRAKRDQPRSNLFNLRV